MIKTGEGIPLALAVTVSCVSPGAASELAVTANVSQETTPPGKKELESEKQLAEMFGATVTLLGEMVTPGGRFVTARVTGPLKFCCSAMPMLRAAGD